MKKRSKLAPPAPPEYQKIIEAFGAPYLGSIGHGRQEPSCFNGIVNVERYRLTVEKIDEPAEVVAERIRKLWRECTNHHHWGPLKEWGRRFGIELTHDEMLPFEERRRLAKERGEV